MTEEPQNELKLEFDDDWKEEARREKEELAGTSEESDGRDQLPPASIEEIINILVMQAVAGLGGMQMPDGRVLPPNMDVAKHHIDLLDLLCDKTKGNLTKEEDQLLKGVTHELQMRFVEMAERGDIPKVSGMPGSDVPGANVDAKAPPAS